MVFSSLLFLFRFLPAVLLFYFIVPRRFRNLVLLLVSLVFYAWGEPVYVFLMILSILISWGGGLAVSHYRAAGRERAAKTALVLSVGAGLSLLGFFKYADFLIRTVNSLTGAHIPLLHLTLPIGISFYTFQTISYIIDVYRSDASVQKNVISYGAYVTMFPQLIAGPIVQYRTIDAQLRSRKESMEEFAQGVNRFMIGLGKKVLLANQAGVLWDQIRVMDTGNMPVLTAWIGICLPIPSRSILTSPAIRIWQSASAICLVSASWKTLIILIWLQARRNSGADGISLWEPGSANMSISRSAATGWDARA